MGGTVTRPSRALASRVHPSSTDAVALLLLFAALTACGFFPDRVALDQIQLDPDDRTMRVVLAECEPDLDLDWEETPTGVAFTASATRASDTVCVDAQTIGLREPLKNRTVTFNGVEVEPVVTEIVP